MSNDLVSINVPRARTAATTLDTSASTPETHSARLRLIRTLGHLYDESGYALAKIDEVAQELRLLSGVFSTRADLAVRADSFPSLAAYEAYMKNAMEAYRRAQQGLRTSLDDDNVYVRGTYFATQTELDDIFGRVTPGNEPWVSDGHLCQEDAWLQGRGQIVGPDGQVYEITIPEIRRWNEDTDSQDRWNMDWGTPEGGSINNLNGELTGFQRTHVEVAIGHDGRQMSTLGRYALVIGGAAGADYGDALDVRQRYGRPAPLSRYDDITFDDSLVPRVGGRGARRGPETRSPLEDIEDPFTTGSTTDRRGTPLPLTPGRPGTMNRTNAAFGVIDLAYNASTAGPDAINRTESEGNGMVVVEYLTHPDGRNMARVVAYQIFEDDDGEAIISMNYAGVNSEGDFVADTPVRPRVQDGFNSGNYATTTLMGQ